MIIQIQLFCNFFLNFCDKFWNWILSMETVWWICFLVSFMCAWFSKSKGILIFTFCTHFAGFESNKLTHTQQIGSLTICVRGFYYWLYCSFLDGFKCPIHLMLIQWFYDRNYVIISKAFQRFTHYFKILIDQCRAHVNLKAVYLLGDWWRWGIGRYVHSLFFNLVKLFSERSN